MTTQPFKLLSKKVGIEPIMPADTSAGGLYIPDIAKERCKSGIVKYVADDVEYVKIGDYVLFGGYTGTWVALEDETILVMHEDFIQGIIENEVQIVPGLYIRTIEGDYIPAPYETIFHIVRNALKEQDKKLVVKNLIDSRDKGDWEKRK